MEQKLITYQWNQMKNDSNKTHEINYFSKDIIDNIHLFQKSHPKYTKTPLVHWKQFSELTGTGNLFIKDESQRFGLNAFKVLGGIYVVGRYIAEKVVINLSELTIEKLTSAEVKQKTGILTFASATDGNHGRGIAWAARELGHQAVIYLPKGAAEERVKAIEEEGAKAVVTDMNYDNTVRLIAKDAEENAWVVVQDTSWEGYEQIPLWIMQGYATLAKEISEQLDAKDEQPTHVFLQAGVGSYAAAVVAAIVQLYDENHPKFILVEPHEANCYFKSFTASDHSFRTVDGELDTIMAGLSCGEPNPQAWEILKGHVDASVSCDDRVSALGMRVLGNPIGNDKRVISGEAGSVTIGLLYCLLRDPQYRDFRDELQLNEHANIVMINTEGDTDEEHYREVVWEGRHPLK